MTNTPPSIPFNRILSPIELRNLKFLVLDCPTDQSIPFYVKELKSRGVTDVVRVCEPTYKKAIFEAVDINVHDWPFKDGGIPSPEIINQFLTLCDERFAGGINASKDGDISKCANGADGPVIAVHCVAGLGRAPALVAIALIESGMSPLDTIEYVRRRRRGAFNTVQLQYLMESYKPRMKKSKGRMTFGSSNKRPSSPTNSQSSKESSNEFANGASGSGAPIADHVIKESTSLFGRLATKFSKKAGTGLLTT